MNRLDHFTSQIILALGTILIFAVPVSAQTIDPQATVDEFLANHDVKSTTVYCRTDIKVPECRTLIRYQSKADGKTSPSFQITFSAPFRQAGGTEFFIKNKGSHHGYIRLSDSTVDGKVNVVLENEDQKIYFHGRKLTIKDLKFGTLIADLSFSKRESLLTGVNGRASVEIHYPRFKARR